MQKYGMTKYLGYLFDAIRRFSLMELFFFALTKRKRISTRARFFKVMAYLIGKVAKREVKAGKWNDHARKLKLRVKKLDSPTMKVKNKVIVEWYVFFKTAVTGFLLLICTNDSRAVSLAQWVLFYLAFDTISYLFYFVIVSGTDVDELFLPGRAILLLLMNYFQLICFFAFFYSVYDIICGVRSWTQALYFSIVTSATVGYGEMKPCEPEGQRIVMIQIIVMVTFTVLYFGSFVSQLGKKAINAPGESR